MQSLHTCIGWKHTEADMSQTRNTLKSAQAGSIQSIRGIGFADGVKMVPCCKCIWLECGKVEEGRFSTYAPLRYVRSAIRSNSQYLPSHTTRRYCRSSCKAYFHFYSAVQTPPVCVQQGAVYFIQHTHTLTSTFLYTLGKSRLVLWWYLNTQIVSSFRLENRSGKHAFFEHIFLPQQIYQIARFHVILSITSIDFIS